MKIIVPMAGRGSRFQNVADARPEFRRPKPLIDVLGKPMVEWALSSLPFVTLRDRKPLTRFVVNDSDLAFVCLEEHETNFHVTAVLKNIFGEGVRCVLIPEVTRGALETVLKAKEHIKPDEDLIISDSDHYFDGQALYEAILNRSSDTEGIIPVFRPADKNPKWSYTLTNANNVALAVGEKDPRLAAAGARANIGAYYFTHGSVFLREASAMIEKNELAGSDGQKEFYVAPLYQRFLNQKLKVIAAEMPRVWGLGTPSDLDDFIRYKSKGS